MAHSVPMSLEGRTERLSANELDWPKWIPLAACAIPIVIAINIAMIRGSFTQTAVGLPVIVIAAIAVLPWLGDVFAGFFVPGRFMPEWIFVAIVLASTGVLITESIKNDPTPFLLVFLTGEMAARLSTRRGFLVAVASCGLMLSMDLLGNYDDSMIWIVGIAMGWFAGFGMQSQMRLTTEMKLRQNDLATNAAAEERSRIAREVHDVIAHSLSVTMLHVTAARMALERGLDRAPEALDSLQEAERQGRNSLNDIRRTVGLLGADEDAVAAPMPTTTDLPKLVTDFRTAGLDVTLSMQGDAHSLPAAAGLSIYRIVQESLTNAAKHASGAPVTVELNVSDEIRLLIRNGTANGAPASNGDGGGLGVRGMIERATILDGTLHAGPYGDGWGVLLTAPIPAAEA